MLFLYSIYVLPGPSGCKTFDLIVDVLYTVQYTVHSCQGSGYANFSSPVKVIGPAWLFTDSANHLTSACKTCTVQCTLMLCLYQCTA